MCQKISSLKRDQILSAAILPDQQYFMPSYSFRIDPHAIHNIDCVPDCMLYIMYMSVSDYVYMIVSCAYYVHRTMFHL